MCVCACVRASVCGRTCANVRVRVRVSHKDSEFVFDVNPTIMQKTRDYLRSVRSCSLTSSAVHFEVQVQEVEQNVHCTV